MGCFLGVQVEEKARAVKRGNSDPDFIDGVNALYEALKFDCSFSDEVQRMALGMICSSNRGAEYKRGIFALAISLGAQFDRGELQTLTQMFNG